MNFIGAAKRLDDIDLPRLGKMIDVGEDELHAFMDVEAGGSGFDSKGRPKMLFEPHVFYRNLSGEKREAAVAAGLAYKKWKPGAYPKDSYPRLAAAIQIDETAALKAASWGLFQILGENYAAAGYANVREMVEAFIEDEEEHLKGCINFLVSKGLDDDLRAHRWAVVAHGYNGASYATNRYDQKLDAAYKKWAKIPDTAWDEPVLIKKNVLPILRRGSKGAHVMYLQERLGLTPDGDFGPKTEGRVKNFQLLAHIAADGVVGEQTWALIERVTS